MQDTTLPLLLIELRENFYDESAERFRAISTRIKAHFSLADMKRETRNRRTDESSRSTPAYLPTPVFWFRHRGGDDIPRRRSFSFGPSAARRDRPAGTLE